MEHVRSLASLTACAALLAAPVTPTLRAQGNETPPVGRYRCLRVLSAGEERAPDLYIVSGEQYRSLNTVGRYAYDARSRIIRWLTGPLSQPAGEFVAVFTPAGGSTGYDALAHAPAPTIDVRRRTDVAAGNARVLQRCTRAD